MILRLDVSLQSFFCLIEFYVDYSSLNQFLLCLIFAMFWPIDNLYLWTNSQMIRWSNMKSKVANQNCILSLKYEDLKYSRRNNASKCSYRFFFYYHTHMHIVVWFSAESIICVVFHLNMSYCCTQHRLK